MTTPGRLPSTRATSSTPPPPRRVTRTRFHASSIFGRFRTNVLSVCPAVGASSSVWLSAAAAQPNHLPQSKPKARSSSSSPRTPSPFASVPIATSMQFVGEASSTSVNSMRLIVPKLTSNGMFVDASERADASNGSGETATPRATKGRRSEKARVFMGS